MVIKNPEDADYKIRVSISANPLPEEEIDLQTLAPLYYDLKTDPPTPIADWRIKGSNENDLLVSHFIVLVPFDPCDLYVPIAKFSPSSTSLSYDISDV